MIPYDADGVQKKLFLIHLTNGATTDLSIDGSVTPQVFKLAPPSNQIWRVAKWMMSLKDEKGFDVETFGSNGNLTHGLQPRIKIGGVTNDILDFNIRNNGDISRIACDMKLHTFGNTDDILVAEWNFASVGQHIRLDGSQGDELQVVVNDNLTNVNSIHIQAQGYIE